MLKTELLIVSLFVIALGFIAYVMVDFTQQRNQRVDWCKQAGGIALVGDKGHYKICLRPDAVIENPNEHWRSAWRTQKTNPQI